MTGVAIAAVTLVAAALMLRCTVFATGTGHHELSRRHPGWETAPAELHALGQHTQRMKTCGAPHPDDDRVTCTLLAHHGGDDHEQRFASTTVRTWPAHASAA